MRTGAVLNSPATCNIDLYVAVYRMGLQPPHRKPENHYSPISSVMVSKLLWCINISTYVVVITATLLIWNYVSTIPTRAVVSKYHGTAKRHFDDNSTYGVELRMRSFRWILLANWQLHFNVLMCYSILLLHIVTLPVNFDATIVL